MTRATDARHAAPPSPSRSRHPLPIVLLLTLVMASGCRSDPNSPQGAAERFVDQRYVLIDATAAKHLSTGLARRKLESEAKLTEGHTIDAETRKPTVRYKLVDKRDDDEQPTFVFEGSIYGDGDDAFTRKWLITTRRDGDTWKVSNFDEIE